MITPVTIASARSYFSSFGGWIFGPAEGTDCCSICSWGGDRKEPNTLGVRVGEGGEEGEVQIESRLGSHSSAFIDLHSIVWPHLGRALSRKRMRFPVELRIERGVIWLPVEGRKRRFTLYTCEESASATVEINNVTVRAVGPTDKLGQLSIRRLTESELGQLIRDHRERHAAREPAPD
jgi:hypothetical protein